MFSALKDRLTQSLKKAKKLNKFTIAGLVFLAWITVFDTHSLLTQFKLSQTLNSLEKDHEHYVDQLQVAKAEKAELETNKEKFAREKFLFHKENEEIIVIQNKDQ